MTRKFWLAALLLAGCTDPGTEASYATNFGLERVARLGAADPPGDLPSRPTYVSRFGEKYLVFVAGNAASPMPQVFDESGEFVSEIGRPGAGPGEFRMPMVGTTTPGDSILVFDIPQARFTLVASEGVRTVSWERHEVAALHVLSWPDSVLAVRWAQSGASAFALLDLSESSASILREFGAERRPPGPNETRALASAPRGGYVWVANSHDFAFHRLDLAGDTLESLAPGAPEFHTESQTPHPDSVPRSYL